MKCLFKTLVVITAVGLTGCQSWPARFTDGVDQAVESAKTRDAHLDHVAGEPGLRFDDALRDELTALLSEDDLPLLQRRGDEILTRAHALALRAVRTEVDRLDDDTRAALKQKYFEDEEEAGAAGGLWQAFVERSDEQVNVLRQRLSRAGDAAAAREVLRSVADRLETPVKRQGRFARMAPWLIFTPMSKSAIDDIYKHEYRENTDVAFESATVYDFNGSAGAGGWAVPRNPQDVGLLARFAPIIVQEDKGSDAAYADAVDRIGHPVTPDDQRVVVETDHAEVYAYARRVMIHGRPHVQLTYTHWYPEHPALKEDDPEAGHVEGVTLRITLDSAGRPAIFETLYNCGCYHRLYPSAALNEQAHRQFGEPMDGKRLAIERAVADKKDLIVPNAVAVSPVESSARPVIRVRAGWHGIVDVGYDTRKYPDEAHSYKSYKLMPYATLERMRTPGGRVTSIFYDNGLVKQAQRPEGVFFTPAGILSAGQPRQRGTQLIHWDNWDFDDPHLFEKALRLPDAF